ncbi:MAG: HAMP domain-containing sensor histidine kinase [Alphaproteobacteria bacterium]|nr:HAMP domain-containing sensor histidine kinase [Alphaproteobacteria bacterium]
MPVWPHTLVARLLLWALVLVAVSVPLFWLFFSVAVERISVQVVDARILELANQVRGYRASAEAFRARSDGPVERPPRLLIGGADADWVWQISVNGQVSERSELLAIAETQLPLEAAVTGPDFQIAEFDTTLGMMRIAGRTIDEAPPFSAETNAEVTVQVQYLAGISLARYAARVEELAARLRQLALLAAIPVSLALLGMLGFIILALRHQLAGLGNAMQRYENAETDGIEGRFPDEIQRVVDRMNGMLRQNMRLIERTRNYVSKIAHDINHPLTVMKNGLKGDIDTDLMNRQVERMTALVDRYTSLARAIGPDGQPARKTAIEPLLQDVVDGFAILYRRTPLAIDQSCPPGLVAAIPKHDLEAMLSNLVSNAHKFADTRVRVSAAAMADGLRLTVEDDGPGIAETLRSAAFNWGKRLDEAPPGTGFGLTIVRDIAELYDGSVTLEQSADLGGLRVDIDLPVPPGLDN